VTETLSIKVPVQTKTRLRAAARSRHTSPSALLREALEVVLSQEAPAGRASLYALARDLFEGKTGSGPRDLSKNKRYLADLGQ
jgi:uncharacterized phosphosugar-binding protein